MGAEEGAEEAADEAERRSAQPRSVVVATRPADLELVDAETERSLGRSPVVLQLEPGVTASVRAKLGSRLSRSFTVDAKRADEPLDLRRWVQQTRRRRRNQLREQREETSAPRPDPPVPPEGEARSEDIQDKPPRPSIRTLDEGEPATGLLEEDMDLL
jgi:hypothetical protein